MNITEYQLRETLITYIKTHTNSLNTMLERWNERMRLGVPIASQFLYDLVGKDIETALKDEVVYEIDSLKRYAKLTVGPWVDRENPFYVTYVYKIEASNYPDDKVLFTLGEERHLLELWEQMIEMKEDIDG